MIQRLVVQIPAEVGNFKNFKNYLGKLAIGNKFQLGNNSIRPMRIALFEVCVNLMSAVQLPA